MLLEDRPTCQPFVTSRTVPVFAIPNGNEYLYDRSQMFPTVTGENMDYPVVVDTEFTKRFLDFLLNNQSNRLGITTQVRGIHKSAPGAIFAHKEVAHLIPRHTPVQTDFHPLDYLIKLGYDVSLRVVDEIPEGLPIFHVKLYGHFLTAEVMMIVEDKCRETIDGLLATNPKKTPDAPHIAMTRRLMAQTKVKTKGGSMNVPYVDLPWILTLEGHEYVVRLSFVDTCALHGVAGYEDLANATGIKVEHKNNFTSKEKGRMLEMAIERPEDFDNYALGDLESYEILESNARYFHEIYVSLGLGEYYQPPKLTIGSTVKDLITSAIKEECDIGADDKKGWLELERRFLKPNSAQHLRMLTNSTNALLAKVFGGLCIHNRPTTIRLGKATKYEQLVKELNPPVTHPLKHNKKTLGGVKERSGGFVHRGPSGIVDLDISGCYGEGQRNQTYPIGIPEMPNWSSGSKRNDYWTLEQFFKEFEGDLGDEGTWTAIVCSTEALKLPQDFLLSWFLDSGTGEDLMAKCVVKMKCDTEEQEIEDFGALELDEEDGNIKILNHEIFNAVIGHNFKQWLENTASPQQRKELLEKLVVKTYMVFPESQRVTNYQELLEAHEKHEGKNTAKRVGKKGSKRLRTEDGECHAWFGVNLGKLIVDKLLALRKCHKKKTPMNTLLKLCVNTLYGVMCSKYFTVSNTCVGNNITARARALAWYMAKGLYGLQVITDGCAFDLNDVVFPKKGRRVTASEVVNFHRNMRNANLVTKSITGDDGTERIDLVWTAYPSYKKEEDGSKVAKTRYTQDLYIVSPEGTQALLSEFVDDPDFPGAVKVDKCPAMDWINKVSMSHLQNLFPNVDVLHKETTSIKPVVDKETGKLVRIDYVPRVGQFEFEAKDYYDEWTCYSAGNYLGKNPNDTIIRARSYETKKQHWSVVLVDGNLVVTERYGLENNPAKDFLTQLSEHPEQVTRQECFVKEGILKPGDYSNRLPHYRELGLVPGDTVNKPGLLREFSLSHFTYKTLQQYRGWAKAVKTHKEKYDQSLERFFTDENGNVNYEEMIRKCDQLIAEGCINPIDALDPNSNLDRTSPHPQKTAYDALRQHLNTHKDDED